MRGTHPRPRAPPLPLPERYQEGGEVSILKYPREGRGNGPEKERREHVEPNHSPATAVSETRPTSPRTMRQPITRASIAVL